MKDMKILKGKGRGRLSAPPVLHGAFLTGDSFRRSKKKVLRLLNAQLHDKSSVTQ